MAKQLFKWLLITSITFVSTSLLMFVSAHIAAFQQVATYYNVSKILVVLLSNTFNIFYLIITPIIFPWLKHKYTRIVQFAVIIIAIGCLGRYLCQNAYVPALLFSMMVAIGHIPIITAPYGLLDMFEPSNRGYASSIPLFVPLIGINFCILYAKQTIVTQPPNSQISSTYINTLNLIIAIVGVSSSILTLAFLYILSADVKKINENSEQGRKITKSCKTSIKNQFKSLKQFFILCLCWATILGLNWTYGGMFGIFLEKTDFSHKEVALIGLFANLSSAFFCNLGNWISNHFIFSNTSIIFYLNVAGFIGSLAIQASTALQLPLLHNKWTLILAIVILRAGFSSFVSLSLIQLNYFGPSVLVSSIFFYLANATNLLSTYLVAIENLSKPFSLGIMSSIIWLCVFVVYLIPKTNSATQVDSMEISVDDVIVKNSQSNIENVQKDKDKQGCQKQFTETSQGTRE